MRRLRDVQRLAESQIAGADGDGVLLLEGSALRLQADIRWLEARRAALDREDEMLAACGPRVHGATSGVMASRCVPSTSSAWSSSRARPCRSWA